MVKKKINRRSISSYLNKMYVMKCMSLKLNFLGRIHRMKASKTDQID